MAFSLGRWWTFAGLVRVHVVMFGFTDSLYGGLQGVEGFIHVF